MKLYFRVKAVGSFAGLPAMLIFTALSALSQSIPVRENFARLNAQEDTDGDKRITIHDRLTPFELRDRNGATVLVVSDVYRLSVLMQELDWAISENRSEVTLAELKLNETVVDRTSRLIRELYWNALTRRIDGTHLDQVLDEQKISSSQDFLYVPAADEAALRYFQGIARGRTPPLRVVALPSADQLTAEFVAGPGADHGLLTLKMETNARGEITGGAPYLVPGGRFNELYYWDSYFIVLGLLQDGRKDLARGMADNLIYEMDYYGMIPNGNRTYYLTRSQPLFLSSIIRAVFESGAGDRDWLASALRTAMSEYREVWLGRDRLVKAGGFELSRYYDTGNGPCPEVEPGHYDEQIAPWLALANAHHPGEPLTPSDFLNAYRAGKYRDLTVDGMTLDAFFKQDRAMRESGHDTTHRFDDRAADFVTVDLNALLYRYEMDFAELLESQFNGKLEGAPEGFGDAAGWRKRASARKQAMNALMWDEARGFYFDYDFVNHKRSEYISATGLYPLWAGMLDANEPADRAHVQRIAALMRAKLEEPAGLAATAKESVESARTKDQRQWDYPYGWPPHQMLAWQGLHRCGLDADAERLAYRWLYTIAKNARDFDGTIPEKLNVVTGSHEVFVEYGKVGTKFSYIEPQGFGWMNASFRVGTNFLSADNLADLRALKPPAEK
jgi:alpha,alpha-trehalase